MANEKNRLAEIIKFKPRRDYGSGIGTLTPFGNESWPSCSLTSPGDESDLKRLLNETEVRVVEDWESSLPIALAEYINNAEKASLTIAILRNERRIEELEDKVDQIATQPFTVCIATLSPRDVKTKRDIPVLVRFNGDEYTASFVDANIGASGETVPEAVDNLKDALAAMFRFLNGLRSNELGSTTERQLAVLKEFIEAK